MRRAINARTQTYDTPRKNRVCSHLPRGSSLASSANRTASRSTRLSGASGIRDGLSRPRSRAVCAAGRLTSLPRPPIFPAVRQGNIPMSLEFSADAQNKISAACERYPTKQPVVMVALHLAQKEHGHLSDDALRLVARTLDL